MPDWLSITGVVVSIVAPLAGLVIGLDMRASAYRREMHAKIDALRAYTEEHHRNTLTEVGKIQSRIAVIEDRSMRVRRGDAD